MTTQPILAPNLIKFEESASKRSFEARFTDQSVDSLSEPLRAFLSSRQDGRSVFAPRARPTAVGGRVSEIPDAIRGEESPQMDNGFVEVPGTVVKDTFALAHAGGFDDREELSRIFRKVGNGYQLDNSQLKGQSKREQAKRLIYLLLYVYNLDERERVSRAVVHETLRDAGLYDSNTLKLLKNVEDLYVEGDLLGLRSTGRQKAREFLHQALDDAVPQVWSLKTGGTTRAKKSGEVDDEESGGTGGVVKTKHARKRQATTTVGGWVKAWNELGTPVDVHGRLRGQSLLEKGLCGLWAIRTAVGDEGKVVSRRSLSSFILDAFEHKVDDRNLARALDKAKDKVIHIGGTGYQINQTGIQHVEQFLGISQSVDAREASDSK